MQLDAHLKLSKIKQIKNALNFLKKLDFNKVLQLFPSLVCCALSFISA